MSDLDNPEAEHVSSTMEQDFEAKTGSTAKEEELVNCIDGRYELKQQLGTGGYGTVFEAQTPI